MKNLEKPEVFMTKLNHLKKIASISEKLDLLGLYSYADIIDSFLSKIAIAPYDLHDDYLYPEKEGVTPYSSPGNTSQRKVDVPQPETLTLPYTRWKASLDEVDDYSTGEIPFSWGRYSARYKPEVYYVTSDKSSNYLGKIQVPGDPFTYDLAGNRIKIISAPHSKRALIGKLISKSDIPEKYFPKSIDANERKPTDSDLASSNISEDKNKSQQTFVSQPQNYDFYLRDYRRSVDDLVRMYPTYVEEISRLARYSGLRSYLNEMRGEYSDWSKFTKENIEDMDPELISLDLLEYLNLHPMIDDFFIDKLQEAIKYLQYNNSLL